MDVDPRAFAGGVAGKSLELPGEVAELVRTVAAAALDAGRAGEAERVLEGLVAFNPRDAAAWSLLARAHLRTGKDLAARFAAEVGRHLAPGEAGARLARAEVLLGAEGDRAAAEEELTVLSAAGGEEGQRAAALLAALGRAPPPQSPSRGPQESIIKGESAHSHLDRQRPVRG